MKNWIRNPRAVKPTTWMPRFFYNSNNSSPEDAVRNEVEINAIVAYLFANAEKHEFAVKNPPRGDAKSGEQIVKSIGCQGCHVVGEGTRDEVGPRRTFGQPLENIGNKTTYEWIYNWVRDPKHYSPATYMPNLRLTDAQVADVATYPVDAEGRRRATRRRRRPTQKAADDVLLDYLKNVMPFEDAKAQLAKMDARAEAGRARAARDQPLRLLQLPRHQGLREGAVDRHRPVGRGQQAGHAARLRVHHRHPAHVEDRRGSTRKLHDPRIFDKGRVLQPLDKLRMPNFDFTDDEVDRLRDGDHELPARDSAAGGDAGALGAASTTSVAGRTLVHRRNCVGCHIIEGDGGDFLKLVADPSLGPPLLTPEGARVQPDWLYAFLRGPITIRPWLNVRMPTFGLDDPNLNGVIRYFGSISNTHRAVPDARHRRASPTSDAAGKQLFELLQVPAVPRARRDSEGSADGEPGARSADGARAAAARLDPAVAEEAVGHPARHAHAGVLAGLSEVARIPQLGGDAEAQIRAIRDHLLTFKGGPSPKAARRRRRTTATQLGRTAGRAGRQDGLDRPSDPAVQPSSPSCPSCPL